MAKNPPAMQKTGLILGWEVTLEAGTEPTPVFSPGDYMVGVGCVYCLACLCVLEANVSLAPLFLSLLLSSDCL